jgi:K+-sensing histidine kinase KdpD
MALGSKSFSKDTLLHANRAISDIDNVVERCLQSERLADDSVVIKDEELCLYNIISNLCNINDAKKRFIININSSITIKTDAQLLNTILSNLIDNALKYSIPDSVISIDSSFEKNGLKIAIENAIKSSNFPDSKRVFQKYYRHKTAHNKTGSGLGLYLVKTISNLLGGDVIYDYYTNKVIFTLWLPL